MQQDLMETLIFLTCIDLDDIELYIIVFNMSLYKKAHVKRWDNQPLKIKLSGRFYCNFTENL